MANGRKTGGAKAAQMAPRVATLVTAIDALKECTGTDFAIPPSAQRPARRRIPRSDRVDGFLIDRLLDLERDGFGLAPVARRPRKVVSWVGRSWCDATPSWRGGIRRSYGGFHCSGSTNAAGNRW
jgi:hypothetical protein